MRKLVSILLMLYCALKSSAQENQPHVYELISDTASSYTIEPPFIQLLEDPKNQWTIDEVSQPPVINYFRLNETKEKGINYHIHTYWLRLTINNNLDHAVTLYLNNQFGEGHFSFEYIYCYAKQDNGKWSEEETGSLLPWSQRAEARFLQTLPLPLKPRQQQTVYLRLRDSFRNFRAKNIDVHFQTTLPFYKQAYETWVEGTEFKDNFIRALLLGIIIATIFFTCYNYLLIQEKAYLYYLFFLLFYSVARLPPFYFLLVPEHPVLLSWWSRPILWILVHTFLVLFVREFLNTRRIAPFWDKLLLLAAAFQGVYLSVLWLTAPLHSFKVHAVFEFGVLMTYEIVIATIALTLIQLHRKHNPSAKFLLLTLAPFLLLYTLVEFFAVVLKSVLDLFLKNQIEIFSFSSKFWVFAEYFTVLWMVVFFSGALTRRYTKTRKALAEQTLETERFEKEKEIEKSQLIAQQKVELEKKVEQRTLELEHSLESLQAAQAQLIQSEKMASLGELTAGIAHEIQNPLNFVNNFSEVNTELVYDLEKEITGGNKEEAMAIASDIKQNLQKVVHHGKRADAIVRGMLQHSRVSTGQREPADINALADEYLRLSYHGLRAKDKSFNAKMETHFDESIGKINIVPQEIGRVLLNLFNNAFYAVHEQKKYAGDGFEPMVSVNTEKDADKVEISVRDNGMGISKSVVDKIFQPFFTTKPTGEGTGLGLSLSYDIVKAHHGELLVKSEEGVGTTFRVVLKC